MKIPAPIKVGILTILSIVILIFGIMWLKGRSISIGEKIEVHFKDVDGMRTGSAVQMMGMRIGQVDEILPVIDGENSYINVKFVINVPGVVIPPASRISIQQSGIIGEKFLEITPPFPETVYIPVTDSFKGLVAESSSVEILVDDNYKTIGEVKKALITDNNYKIDYVLTVPDFKVPLNSSGSLVKTIEEGKYKLRLTPPEDVIVKLPDASQRYTVIEPLRINDFLDIQLKAALALKETNDRINDLLTEEFMDDVRFTLENTKDLSEKASLIVDHIAEIVDSSKEDIKQLIVSSTKLSENMAVLSANVNEIVKDSEFKENIIATTAAIRSSSEQFSELLENSKLQETMLNINSTSKDTAEIVQYVNNLTKDKEFNERVEMSVDNLNTLMVKLSGVADTLDELTTEEKETIKEILDNSNEASKNLNKFSKKLNRRFLLLRLLFN